MRPLEYGLDIHIQVVTFLWIMMCAVFVLVALIATLLIRTKSNVLILTDETEI